MQVIKVLLDLMDNTNSSVQLYLLEWIADSFAKELPG